MIRRRCPTREIPFSFDSFLDVVANVVGIIIRLILVVWVGARSYTGLPPEFAARAPIEVEDTQVDPLHTEIVKDQKELAEVQAKLILQLRRLRNTEGDEAQIRQEMSRLASRRKGIDSERGKVDQLAALNQQQSANQSLTLEEIRKRFAQLGQEIEVVRKMAPVKHALRYRTPVSRPVDAEEVMFECKGGRVCLIDIAPMLDEIRRGFEDKALALRTRWQVEDVAGPVGAFQLRYVLERERGPFEDVLPGGSPDSHGAFRYGLNGWQLEPVLAKRGETLQRALARDSDFRQVVNGLDARQTVVTFWVYPDSFPMYRQLRDFLYDQDIIVAGRPLPEGVPISSSKHGSVSRGQ